MLGLMDVFDYKAHLQGQYSNTERERCVGERQKWCTLRKRLVSYLDSKQLKEEKKVVLDNDSSSVITYMFKYL